MKLLFSHNETPSIIITMEVDDLPIELEVADALKSGHLMMGTAESCTGGKIKRLAYTNRYSKWKDCQHDNLHGGQLGILHRGRGSLLQRGEASCARCLRGGLEHFRGRKPAGRGADGPWDYAGIGM